MKDINFFEPFESGSKKKKQKKSSNILPVLLVILIFVSIFAYQGLIFAQKIRLTNEIDSINVLLNDEKTKKAYDETLEIELIANELNSIYESANTTDQSILNEDTIAKAIVEDILNAVPENTYLVSLSYENDIIQVDCVSDQYDTAAQYTFNLKTANSLFNNVFLPSIYNDDGDYYYTIEVQLEGGINE